MSIYLDNAATSFPKPEAVYRAVDQAQRELGANPGRGGHRLALDGARLVFETREALAEFFDINDSSRIAFTNNATSAINQALFGLLQPGDRVVTSSMEHNSVTRPLRVLQERGVQVVKVAADSFGRIDPAELRKACSAPTRLVVLSHCSNVTGTLQPLEQIGPWCRKQGILLLVDAAQSAGIFPLQVEALGIDLLAVPGHKGLLGPLGTGMLYVRPGLQLTPLMYGGTGGNSASDLPIDEMPDRLECGTLNATGLAGLKAGVEYLQAQGINQLRALEVALMKQLIEGLRQIAGVDLYGPLDPSHHGAVLSFNLQGVDPAELGYRLDHDFDILVRVGLHCSPDAHRSIGTFPRGTVRVSPGHFNTSADISQLLAAVAALAAESRT